MLTLVTIPTDLLAQVSATASPLFNDLFPFLAFVVGISLAFWVISWIIRTVRHNPDSGN